MENSGRTGQATEDNTTWRMQAARQTNKVIQTQPEYVEYFTSAGQKLLLERA